MYYLHLLLTARGNTNKMLTYCDANFWKYLYAKEANPYFWWGGFKDTLRHRPSDQMNFIPSCSNLL
jgi:hypothetical protein